jgi:hypothetical protein
MTKRKTNVQTVKAIMEFSNYGALAQVFVMEAVGQAAERVAKLKPEDLPDLAGGFISAEAWVGVAQEIQTKLKEAGY